MRRKLLLFAAGVVWPILFWGCPIRVVVDPKPSPSPSPTAGTPSPEPSETPTPKPSESPSPSPIPPPTPIPPTPTPSVSPCVPQVGQKQCMTKDGVPATGCVSCDAFMQDALRKGDLVMQGGFAMNRGEYFDPRTCFTVWPDGSLRNKRLLNDGTVCGPDCVAVPKPAVPCPSPTATPTPTPSVTPPPGGGEAPPLTSSGNYPRPPLHICPPWFKDATARVGIRVAGMVNCGEGQNCKRVTLWATQKSVKPYCEHSCYDENGVYNRDNCRLECELWHACQEPQFIDYVDRGDPENPGNGIVMQISHPDWGNQWGRMDKQTCDSRHNTCPPEMHNPVHNFNGHDKAVDRAGITKARACMPDYTKCSETEYRTDR